MSINSKQTKLFGKIIYLDDLENSGIDKDFVLKFIGRTGNIRIMKSFKDIGTFIFSKKENIDCIIEYYEKHSCNGWYRPPQTSVGFYGTTLEKTFMYMFKQIRIGCIQPDMIKYIHDKYKKMLISFIKQKVYIDDYIKKMVIRLAFILGLQDELDVSYDYIIRAKQQEFDQKAATKKRNIENAIQRRKRSLDKHGLKSK